MLYRKSLEDRGFVLRSIRGEEEHCDCIGSEERSRNLGENADAVAAATVGCYRSSVTQASQRDQRAVDHFAGRTTVERGYEPDAAGVGIKARVEEGLSHAQLYDRGAALV
jgi:hypothetical protein